VNNPEYRDNSVVVHVTPNLNVKSILEMCDNIANSPRPTAMRVLSKSGRGRYMSYSKLITLPNDDCKIASIQFIYQDAFMRVNHPAPFSYAINHLSGFEYIILKGQIVTRQIRDKLKAASRKIRLPFPLAFEQSNV